LKAAGRTCSKVTGTSLENNTHGHTKTLRVVRRRWGGAFYSFVESPKLCGVEPRADLWGATLRAVRNPGTVTLARDFKSSES
jgi:hypothetical protein